MSRFIAKAPPGKGRRRGEGAGRSKPSAGPRYAPRRSRTLRAALVLGLVFATGCATYTDRNLAARQDLKRGDFGGAEQKLNRLLGVESSRDLPGSFGSDTALTLLERATVLQAMGEYELSARDFSAAERDLEFLDIANDTVGEIGKYVFSDDSTKYKTSPTEKLHINALNMINYLALGDLSGARVEARRFQVMRKYLADHFPDEPHGAFGSYLAGYVFEKSGEVDTALRHYDEVLVQMDTPLLDEPVRRLAARSSFRTPRIEAVLARATTTASTTSEIRPEGEILVILKLGTVPAKQAARIPIGAALGLAANYVSGDTKVLEYGLFKVVSYPELIPHQDRFVNASLRVGERSTPIHALTDISQEIVSEYERLKPKIVGAALTRMIVRAASAEAARAVGNRQSGALGFLTAALVEGTLVAMDKPDTRSWSMLPARVYLARIRVPPGSHSVRAELQGSSYASLVREVEVPEGGFALVDFTTLR